MTRLKAGLTVLMILLKLRYDDNVSDWREISDADDPEVAADEVANSVVDKMIVDAMNSPAVICIIPLQDCLHLDTEARMNTPGTVVDNWQWQFQWQQVDIKKTQQMRELIEIAGRLEHLS